MDRRIEGLKALYAASKMTDDQLLDALQAPDDAEDACRVVTFDSGDIVVSVEPIARSAAGRVTWRYSVEVDGEPYADGDTLETPTEDPETAACVLLDFLAAGDRDLYEIGEYDGDEQETWFVVWRRLRVVLAS